MFTFLFVVFILLVFLKFSVIHNLSHLSYMRLKRSYHPNLVFMLFLFLFKKQLLLVISTCLFYP